ncbi:MAG: ABC transporter permease [Firmicutes bacterium]|nr:ABC transporter permease [Bacillota bacterium]
MANQVESPLARRKQIPGLEFFQRMTKSWSSKLGFIVLAVIVLFCVFGPLFSPYTVDEYHMENMYALPSLAHPFGCDHMGRDIMVRLMVGGRYSLLMGIIASLASAVIGVAIGLIAGYFGGIVETILMRFMDVWSALPGMLLCIIISSALGEGFTQTIIALTIGSIPGCARMTRGQVLAERSKEYIEAAESINCSKVSIMFRHLLPNVIQPTIVVTTMGIGSIINMAASLSYIGLGVQPPTPEWGAMLADAKGYIMFYPHLMAAPGIIIALTVLAVNLLGDGLRDALDPKLRG